MNVVATGVITIPMIKQRGFSPHSQVVWKGPHQALGKLCHRYVGAAAFEMSDLTGISYLTIITAALLPALAYYAAFY